MKDQALYLEADEDITSAIDKLTKTTGEKVQIVVPKRSTMLQSIINLKLLKKAAADSGKELVLVTGDKVATDLAARVGLAVAPALGAAAVLANAAPAPASNAADDVIEADDPEPAAAAAAAATAEPTPPKKPFFNRSKVTDKTPVTPVPDPSIDPEVMATAAGEVAPKRSLPKVPNFGKLQRRMLWIGSALVLIIGYFVAMAVFTHASVTLYAAGTKTSVDTTFTVDPNQTTSNIASGVLAGQTVTFSKDLSEAITPTGQQDQGTKASGTMTVVNNDTVPHDFVAGTRFLAPDGKVFVSNAAVHVDAATAGIVNHQPVIIASKANVGVTASQNGDSYNEAPSKYTIPGLASDQQQYTYGQGAQMSGGTSKVVTVVSQDDLDKAQADLLAKDKDASQKSLDGKVPTGYVGISGSTTVAASNVTASPALNQPLSGNATVSLHATYTELAVKQSDYEAFLTAREQTQVGPGNQIYDDGLSSAQVTATGKDSSGRQQFHLATSAYSGAKLDKTAIAASLTGKKYGDATDLAGKLPGVEHATIALSPSWASKLPGARKIKVAIQVASTQ